MLSLRQTSSTSDDAPEGPPTPQADGKAAATNRLNSTSAIIGVAIAVLRSLWAYPSGLFDSTVPYASKATRRLGVRIAIVVSIVLTILAAVLKGWVTRAIGKRRSTKSVTRNETVVEIKKIINESFGRNSEKCTTPRPGDVQGNTNGILMSTPQPKNPTIAFSESPAPATMYTQKPPPRSADAFYSPSSASGASTEPTLVSPVSPIDFSQTQQPMVREDTQPPTDLTVLSAFEPKAVVGHASVLSNDSARLNGSSVLKGANSRSNSSGVKNERRIKFSEVPTPPAHPIPPPALVPSPLEEEDGSASSNNTTNTKEVQEGDVNDATKSEAVDEPDEHVFTLKTKLVANRFGSLASKSSGSDMNAAFGEAKPARTSARQGESSSSRRERKAAEREASAKEVDKFSNREALLALPANCTFAEFKDSLKKQPQTVMGLPDFVMLVGIPGSGKTKWATEYVDRMDAVGTKKTFTVVSSDAVRQQITGHIDNQSQNTLVWEVVLGMCQGYLRSGTSVILDGTNVDTEKRRRFLRRLIMGDRPRLVVEGPPSASSTPTQTATGPNGFPAQPQSMTADKKKVSASASDEESRTPAAPSTPTLSASCNQQAAPLPSLSSAAMLEAAVTLLNASGYAETTESNGDVSHSPIDCNRLLKLLTTSKIICRKRVRDDLRSGVQRSNVPESVIDLMATRLQEAGGALQDEKWIAIP